jgi:quercetin dioxygenase-like cupin family protein
MILLVCTFSGVSQVQLASKQVLLNNQQVEVIRAIYPIGTESGMHTHHFANRVVYFEQGGQLELISNDPTQKPTILIAEKGKTLFLPATTHNVKNIGNTEVIIIETEIK